MKANAICERVIGTTRRECLEWLIPVSETHLRAILKYWVRNYNGDALIARWDRVCRIRRRNMKPSQS